MAYCPNCGVYVTVEAGQPTPLHQPEGDRATCGGSGKDAKATK